MVETRIEQSIHPEDPDDEWATAVNSGRAVRLRLVTGGLVLLLVLAGGFWGGVIAEKHHGSGSSALSTLASRFAAARAAAGSGTGAGFAGLGGTGAGGALTTGTVIDVQGDVVDISDSSGNIVKVQVGPSATVTRTAKTSPSGLQVGDTVVVTGATGSGGTVKATAVRASAQGVTAGGGLGGFRGATGATTGG